MPLRLWLALICWALCVATAHAQQLQGRITDTRGEALPYATVAIQGTTQGTVATEDGQYVLHLPAPGSYTLQVRHLSHKTLFQTVQVQAGQQQLHFKLEPEDLEMQEVMITAGGEDPAYPIMRQAIARKQKNYLAVQAYSAKAYTKMMFYNRKEKKVEYLSETFSTLFVAKPDKRREVIHNSRVSGDSKTYSFAGSLFSEVNLYTNLISFGQLFERDFVSPVADNALFFYRFKYQGNFKEKGQNIYKIEVTARRAADPVLQGTLYIADGSYAIKGADLYIHKNQPMRYLDTLRFKQDYLPLADSLWVPFNNTIQGTMQASLLGLGKISVEGAMLNVYSDYQVSQPNLMASAPARLAPVAAPTPTPTIDKRSKKQTPNADSIKQKKAEQQQWLEALRIEKKVTAQNRNTAFWDSLRPAALTPLEVKDFRKGDSLEAKRDTKAYKDSVNRKNNQFKTQNIFFGYTFTNIANRNTLSIGSPLSSINFNPFEGWNANLDLRKRWYLTDVGEDRRYFQLAADLRYGWANRRLSWQLGSAWILRQPIREVLYAEGGDYVFELSPDERQMNPSVNTLYALYDKRNFLRLMQQQFGRLRYTRRLWADNRIELMAQYTQRTALQNHTDYAFVSREGRAYPPNLPMPQHQGMQAGVLLSFGFNNRYFTTPEGKYYISSSNLPRIIASYRYGRNWGTDSLQQAFAADMHTLRLRVQGGYDLKLLGEGRYMARTGFILSNGAVQLPDRLHVLGNETIYREDNIARFGVLDFYQYNSPDRFAELHLEHNFRGFWLNKLPLIRKLKLHEVAGLHTVQMPGLAPHTELHAGITNLRIYRISLLRLNYHYVLTGAQPGRSAFTFTMGFGL